MRSGLSVFDKAAIAVRLRINMLRFRARQRRSLAALMQGASPVDSSCPICDSRHVVAITFNRPNEAVIKHLCRRCEHLYGESMQVDLAHVRAVFKIETENDGAPAQRDLLKTAVHKSGLTSGTFLDFGVGGNLGAFQQVAIEMPEHTFMGCDVYPAAASGYFVTYDAGAPLGIFDGISSYAVVEHLTNTVEAWRRFNQLLRPVGEGGGIMVHAFPSQWNIPYDDWAMQISGHTCLFSRKSLRLACKMAGFEITRADPPRFVGPHYHAVMEFRKVRDVN